MKSTKHSPYNKFKEAGQGFVEYALILLFVGLAVVLVVSLMEPAIGDVFSRFVAQAPVAPPSLLNYTPPPTFTPSDPDASPTPLTPIPSITVVASETPTPTNTPVPSDTPTATSTTPPTATVPCTYGPHEVPSGGSVRIEMEDFRCGGPGVSFSDRSDDGGPGSDDYRTDYGDEGPDLQSTLDNGGGYNLGWTQDGEWLEYEIEAPTTSAYNFVIRHASIDNRNPQVQISTTSVDFGYQDSTSTLSVGTTGGWQIWQDYTAAVTLYEGTNIVRFNIANGPGNYNYFEIQPYAPTPLPGLQLYLEAESGNGLTGNSWVTANSGSASGGQYIYWSGGNRTNNPSSNNHVTYSFNAPSDGLYQVHLRANTRNSFNDDSVWVAIDGADLSQSQNITRSDGWVMFNNMAGSSSWLWDQVHNQSSNAPVEFYLTAGSQTLRLAYRENDTWIDRIYITNTGNAP